MTLSVLERPDAKGSIFHGGCPCVHLYRLTWNDRIPYGMREEGRVYRGSATHQSQGRVPIESPNFVGTRYLRPYAFIYGVGQIKRR